MSQFYQVTSLEELHRIYPNLQFDNEDGVSSVIQDDKGTQYIDEQGKQVITAVESSGMQFSPQASSQQCHMQQSQFIVHQPTQYIIHQMDSNESQQATVQYIQQRPQLNNTINKNENLETQFQDQGIGCTATDTGDEKPLPQCIIKADGSHQYISQVQPVLHQSIQISAGGNILEFQNQDSSMVGNMIKQESTNPKENQDKQNSQIVVQTVKQKQITSPTSQMQENQECGSNKIVHSTHIPHSVNQQQLMHQSRQQILQSVRYYNQLTVIDGYSPSNETVEQNAILNENILQRQHVILPQEFETANHSVLANRMTLTRKVSQQEVDGSVFLVEEIESPFLVREAQPKLCFQTSVPSTNKSTENVSTQPVVTQNEKTPIQETTIPSRQEVPTKISISEPKLLSDSKTIGGHQFPRFTNPVQARLRAPFPQILSTSAIHPQSRTPGRGRGARFSPRGGRQYTPRVQRSQIQTSPPQPSNLKGIANRGGKSPQGGKMVAKGETVSKIPDERQDSFVQTSPQVSLSPGSKDETCQVVKEPMEEARMVVFLGNGEKKIIRIPYTQNIVIGQLLQQAGISVSNNTPFTIEHVVDSDVDQFLKNCTQKLSTPFKGTTAIQVPTNLNSLVSRSIVGTIQQRPRVQSPQSPIPANINIVRHSLHVGPRMANCPRASVGTSISSESQNTENSTPVLIPKEEPRYIPGLMAICPFCGISSLDFNKCIRCRRKLPENVKSHPIFCQKKKKATGMDKISTGSDRESKSEEEDKQSDSPDKKLSPGSDKKKCKLYPKKKKIHDEPTEILILSSDEEEDNKPKKTISLPTLSKLKKEPDYSDLKELEMAILSTDGTLSENLMKNVQPGLFTTLYCRTIRIGSFKVQPKERVYVSAKGVRFAVHSLKNEPVEILIPVNDIVKILAHFGKQIPVLFIYPFPKAAGNIRKILGMDNKNGPYYDPASETEDAHKRLAILLEKFTEDNKTVLQKIFTNRKLEELSEKEANEVLLRTSPKDFQTPSTSKTEDCVKKIMVYPPPPEKGGITLNNQDYACLGEDQFLNDVIIDFYLKYLMLKVLSPTDRNRTHVFSTFFYKRLTTKPKRLRKNDPENDPKLSPAEKRHLRVKGWTKQVNLFEKDFIIVPINEHSHWFLAIICFPGLTGPVRFSDNTPIEPEEIAPKKSSETVQIGNTTITHIIKSDGNTINLGADSYSDRDEAEGDQDDLHPSSDEESEQAEEDSSNNSSSVQIPLLAPSQSSPAAALSHVKDLKLKTCKKKAFKDPIKQPCILIFDSLAGASRVRVVATLRDYLKIEYKKKMGQDRDFSKDTIKGAIPKVPQQNNFTDCGLYVLQYVESFFQDPLHDFKLPLKYLQDWFPEEIVSCKRQKLANLIRSLMEEQGLNVEEVGLPQLTFGNGKNPSDEQKLEEDEVEDEEELNDEEEELLRRFTQKNLAFEDEHDPCGDMEDDENEEEEEEENEDFVDEGEDDLESGEVSGEWFASAASSRNKFESSGKQTAPVVFRTTAIVNYEASDTGEEDDEEDERGHIITYSSSDVFNENQAAQDDEVPVEKLSGQEAVVESRKSVPLIAYQDFESQIRCTKIERSFDGSECGSDMASEGEIFDDDEEGGKGVVEEEANCVEAYDSDSANPVLKSFNKPLKTASSNEVSVKDSKSLEVSDIIKKLVNDKSITISRKEELNSTLIEKRLSLKKSNAQDCDKNEGSQNSTSPESPDKRTLTSCKRSFQALKNVRIQKKADRNSDLCSKRQKVEDG